MKKAIEIGLSVVELTYIILWLSDIHNTKVRKVRNEQYAKGYDDGEKWGRRSERLDILFRLCKDGVITVDTYNKYVI